MRPLPFFQASSALVTTIVGEPIPGRAFTAVASCSVFAAAEAVRPRRTVERIAAAASTSSGVAESAPTSPSAPDNRGTLLRK